ncbi:MAG TPA: SMP-30/gluconolactonase/LRE family protein, partial [Vicinamibacterales bacterium]|nr:SMP-30/gluconolactonase/LRE family protein [Vicinamibacterales bacterium]
AERTCTDPGGQPESCTELTAVSVLTPARLALASRFEGKPLGRLNDLVVDSKGGVYFTVGGAYYVGPNGGVRSLGGDLRTNGVMLSRDEKIVYVTNGNAIVAFDILPDGGVANRRNFATLDAGGNGDGMAIDDEGRLYVTSAPGVQVLSPEGKYLGLIPTPSPGDQRGVLWYREANALHRRQRGARTGRAGVHDARRREEQREDDLPPSNDRRRVQRESEVDQLTGFGRASRTSSGA